MRAHKLSNVVCLLIVGAVFSAACSTGSSSSSESPATDSGDIELVTPDGESLDLVTPDGEPLEFVSGEGARAMPADGNRLIDGQADFSVEPTITDGFGGDGVIGLADADEVLWLPFQQSLPVEFNRVAADEIIGVRLDTDAGSLASDPLPGSFVVEHDDIAVVLTEPTDRYPHGALGDTTEAAAITIVPIGNDSTESTTIQLDSSDVVEGLSAMLADLDGDGTPEIIVTVANAATGARIVAFDLEGQLVAESDPIGTGNRWRHQIAVGPTGPNGETEIVVVRTPHIGGIVEWFKLVDGRLEIAATFSPSTGGINTTSHVNRTTNLDLAAVFDADGDGALELVIPTQDRSRLAVIGRTDGGSDSGAELEQLVELPGIISSNLATVSRSDGTIAVGVINDDGQLVSWGD